MKLFLRFCLGLGMSLLSSVSLWAQSSQEGLPMMPEVGQALERGTRNPDGTPGPNYWQNRARYDLKASLEPATRLVEATGTLTYVNQSPRALDTVVLRLHQNLYRRGFDERDDRLGPEELTEGVQFSQFILQGDTLDLDGDDPRFQEDRTLLYLLLAEPLASGDSLTVEAAWSFTMTGGSTVRQGTYEEYSFFVGYWYPQFAVYDDIHGWDTLQYRGLHEFYQDFADFSVEVTVPDSFIVWATGLLQNPDEVLTPTYASRLEQAMRTQQITPIVGKEDYDRGTAITTPGEANTWRFEAQHVPDFSFATADFYYWDATHARIEGGERRVWVDACYNPRARDFYSVAEYAQTIIEFMSDEMPGIPYPYPAMTVFNGDMRGFGGGMEFPMMCNDGTSFAEPYTFELTHHEIAHTYFPFMTGINERRYAWMEEGWASFLPTPLMERQGYTEQPMYSNVASYQGFAGDDREEPLVTTSYTVRGQGYWVHAYQKPAVAYAMLQDELGDSTFKACLQAYIRRWEGKHPTPYDFFHTFEAVSGRDLDWFFEPWFFETGAPDLALEVEKMKRRVKLQVQREGSYPVPVYLTFQLKDGSEEERYFPASTWQDGQATLSLDEKFSSRVISIQLGNSEIPDANRKNNEYDGE